MTILDLAGCCKHELVDLAIYRHRRPGGGPFLRRGVPPQDRPLAPRAITTDKAAMIDSREKLEAWLKDRPVEFAQVIAARVALRVLLYALGTDYSEPLANRLDFALLRASILSWSAQNFSTRYMGIAGEAAAEAVRDAVSAGNAEDDSDAAYAVFAAVEIFGATSFATRIASQAAVSAADAVAIAAYTSNAEGIFWDNVSADCDWLEKSSDPVTDARRLTREPLWPRGVPEGWDADWANAKSRLLARDPSWQVWTDWYDRRIIGHRAAFDIPGDTNRIEDKQILAALADAANEDFWDKGFFYVNTTLGRWLTEARMRAAAQVAPDAPLPEQSTDAINYGVNDHGQLDRLPAQDQQHLRDIPDQQYLYGRIREAALELLGEGQRLGVPLSRALDRFAAAMPKEFAAALALPLWTEGIILRRLYRAHRLALENKEFSRDQLEPIIGEGLGGLLDLYNHFAFGDPGLRAKDETRIAPQERADAETEAAAAAPLAAAILQARDVATDSVIQDIEAEADNADLPAGDPFADQAREQTNRNWRNRVAGILTGLRRAVVGVGKETTKAVYSGIVTMGMEDAATGSAKLTALGLLVATNAQAFTTYVSTAFPTFNLTWLIEAIARVFG